MPPLSRFSLLVALFAVPGCAGEHATDAPAVLAQYVTSEHSRVLWPLAYYTDSSVAHYLHAEYLTIDASGSFLTRESTVRTTNLGTGEQSFSRVHARMTLRREGNMLLLGVPDVCAPQANCAFGRRLRIDSSGVLIEAAGRYGADSIVFGPLPSLL